MPVEVKPKIQVSIKKIKNPVTKKWTYIDTRYGMIVKPTKIAVAV